MQIEIDFDVFKELTASRRAETVSYNDMLRELLNLPESRITSPVAVEGWTWKGVTLPNGTDCEPNTGAAPISQKSRMANGYRTGRLTAVRLPQQSL